MNESTAAGRKRPAVKRLAMALLGGGVLGLAAWAIAREITHVEWPAVHAALVGLGPGQLIVAVALTIASYVVLTGYDTLALRQLGRPLAYRRTALASFVGYVFNMNVGFSIVGSTAVRFRMYSRWGLGPAQIAAIVGFCALTTGLGLAATGGVMLLAADPPETVAPWIKFHHTRLVGALLAGAVLAYVVVCARSRRPWRIRAWQVTLPSWRVALGQLALAPLDLLAAGGALFVLLPVHDVSFATFMTVYLFAIVAGLVSHVPGGIGVLESVVLVGLPTHATPASLCATLLAYRGIYYFGPFALGLIALTAHEWRRRRVRFAVAGPPPAAQG